MRKGLRFSFPIPYLSDLGGRVFYAFLWWFPALFVGGVRTRMGIDHRFLASRSLESFYKHITLMFFAALNIQDHRWCLQCLWFAPNALPLGPSHRVYDLKVLVVAYKKRHLERSKILTILDLISMTLSTQPLTLIPYFA